MVPVKWSGDSAYFQVRTVKSIPADAIWVGEMNFAVLMLDVWPPMLEPGDVAMTCPDLFHIRSSPSYEADRMRSWFNSTRLPDKISTALTQSSCSKLASYNGGIRLRTYCRLSVDSEERPLAVRYSSRVVRRKVPLIKKSKGMGEAVSSIDSELRIWERPYLRTSECIREAQLEECKNILVGTSSCLFPSGNSISGEFVVK